MLLLSGGFWLFLPQTSFAQADLQASTPQEEAVLRVTPRQVHLWMSERLSPTLSDVEVVNERNQGVEVGSSQVVGKGAQELEVGLIPSLPPGVYVVAWHAVSKVDGRATDGTFHFTILLPDGRVPSTQAATIPGLGDIPGSSSLDLFDESTLLLIGATILLELLAVFWTGAAIWRGLVLPSEEEGPNAHLMVVPQRRFEQWWACPTIALLLLAHLAWIIAHLMAEGVDVVSSSFSMIASLVIGETAGRVWIGQVLLLLLALRLSVFRVQQPLRSPRVTTLLTWGDLLLGLGIFPLLVLSSQNNAATNGVVLLSVLSDWGHLFAAAFWIGSILFLVSCCLPLLPRQGRDVQAHFFLTVLPASSPWTLAGVLLMTVTGLLQATEHVQQWSDLFSTSYGVVLVSESLLGGVLLLLSGLVVGRLQPRFRQTWEQYCSMRQHVSSEQQPSEEPLHSDAQQIKSQEILLAQQIQQMRCIMWVEAGVGVGILIGAGLLTVLARSLS